ncbi:hypothetical protein, partial [Mesorhizobium sp. M0520]|uniref:hypothetical protein n=1 Tax=Mesorhizobium sp. M0520 TaxID=2956957 RepID=UPI0033388B27
KVKKRVWVFFAEGQRSLPHPHYRKRCAPRRSFKPDITHETAAFNHDRTGKRFVLALYPSVVAQMTRFGLTPKAPVNQQPFASRSKRRIPAMVGLKCDHGPSREPGNCRRIATSPGGALAKGRFFKDNSASLLIVPALFFIHRRNGEVAEWSKALPC